LKFFLALKQNENHPTLAAIPTLNELPLTTASFDIPAKRLQIYTALFLCTKHYPLFFLILFYPPLNIMTNCILNAKKFYYPKENFQHTIEFGLEFALETETEDLKPLLF